MAGLIQKREAIPALFLVDKHRVGSRIHMKLPKRRFGYPQTDGQKRFDHRPVRDDGDRFPRVDSNEMFQVGKSPSLDVRKRFPPGDMKPFGMFDPESPFFWVLLFDLLFGATFPFAQSDIVEALSNFPFSVATPGDSGSRFRSAGKRAGENPGDSQILELISEGFGLPDSVFVQGEIASAPKQPLTIPFAFSVPDDNDGCTNERLSQLASSSEHRFEILSILTVLGKSCLTCVDNQPGH